MILKKKLIHIVFGLLTLSGLLGWVSYDAAMKEKLLLYENVIRTIELNYIEEIDAEQMIMKSIRETAAFLDPYSKFFDAEETKKREEHGWNGILYGGVGINLLQIGDYVNVTHVRKGYGAAKEGLKVGDRILRVDERDVKGLSSAKVSELIVGPEGTLVTLKIERGSKRLTKKITRALIRSLPVPYYVINGTCGYVKFDHFLRGSSVELKSAVQGLLLQGIEQLILDIRGNYGGLIDEATSAASLFLPKGSKVMSQIGRAGATNYSSFTETEPICHNLPIVLLTDSMTISSAEIFAGAMQDSDRMLIVGETTAGKGIVQTTYYPGLETSLYITVSGYYTPSGRSIQNLEYDGSYLGQNPVKANTSNAIKYFTQNGREVFARGGIEPDSPLSWADNSPYVNYASASKLAYDFLNQYANKASVDDVNLDFVLQDRIFDEIFESILESSDSLKMRIDAQLKEVEDSWLALGFENDDKFKPLRETVRQNKKEELLNSKESIRREFEKEILRRLYFEKGVYYRNVKSDFEKYDLMKYFSDYDEVLKNSK